MPFNTNNDRTVSDTHGTLHTSVNDLSFIPGSRFVQHLRTICDRPIRQGYAPTAHDLRTRDFVTCKRCAEIRNGGE